MSAPKDADGPGQRAGSTPDAAAAPPASVTLLTAAVSGAGVMSMELAAVRLLAPWYGTSSAVWTNVIGVILLALSLGYLLGARAAAGAQPARAMMRLLAIGGGLVCLLPFLAGPVAELFLPAGLALEQAVDLAAWGSLASTALLFLLPAALLGGVGPLAVELVQTRTAVRAGTAGGRVLCVSTLGSLAGTFATTHLLLPTFGTAGTFLCAGLLLVAAAVVFGVCTGRLGRALSGTIPGAALAAIGLLLGGSERPLGESWVLIEARESSYQSLRVVGTEDGQRWLQVNEGLDSYQSVWSPTPGLLGPGYYYDYLALPLGWPGPPARRVLVLGLGAGTVFRVMRGAAPPGRQLELTGIELDPDVIDLGRRHFDLDDEEAQGARVLVGDARVGLRGLARAGERFELVVLDCYANQSEIPPHLITFELFEQIRGVLTPDGTLAVNVGGFSAEDPVVDAVGSTLATAFEGALGLRVPNSRNWVLYAGAVPPEPQTHAEGELATLLPPLRLPGALHRWPPQLRDPWDVPVLTDDWAPTDQLQRASLRAGRAGLRADPEPGVADA